MRQSLSGRTPGELVDVWPFADPPNTAAITTRPVLEQSAPILRVVHDADDGTWQFLCGTTGDPAEARVVGLGRMGTRDASLRELADLPEGWHAWRAGVGAPWQRGPA
ncbi:MAG: hypothetical protein ACREOC_06435 [Gemmatimonadales bacterium]